MKKYTILSFLFIFLISAISVFDLVFNIGRPVTFDGPTHMADIGGYSQALLSGDFPVFWLDKFGNYGMPVGFFSHQLPLTFAGLVDIPLHNPLFVYSLFFFLGIFLTNCTFYAFLRIYFSRFASLAGITLLTFSAYRITNIYIRGDLPETFSGIFLGLILLGTYYFIVKNKLWAFFLIALSYFCLAITHPMMLMTYALLIFPYLLFVVLTKHGVTLQSLKQLFLFGLAIFFGIGMGLYFVLPLFLETKYLYFGLEKNHLSPQFLSWKNFFGESWFYFYNNDIAPRGQFIQIGSIECATVIGGFIAFVRLLFKKGLRGGLNVPGITVVGALLVLFLTSVLAIPFYQHISILTDVQFPWRFLSVFIFLPPILIAAFFHKIKNFLFVLLFILLIAFIRFPQLYGKNYAEYPVQNYYFTQYNLFPIFMNTIWTGKTEDYPIEKTKIGIISGTGKIISTTIHNSSRLYTLDAQTPLRVVDYTFYFPGWHVYVDGKDTPIEFQDPNYRGVITYTVPQGQHTIHVVSQDTSIRKLGKLLSVAFIILLAVVFIFRKKFFAIFV